MKLEFTNEDILEKINVVEIEDIVVDATHVCIEDDVYTLFGKALIDGEIFPEFVVEFILENTPDELTAKTIVEAQWEEYDFIFN